MAIKISTKLAVLTVLFCVTQCFAEATPKQTAEKHSPFVAVLFRNWEKWDIDKDGILSGAEVDRVVLDPTVKGADAAAAGTLKLMLRSKKVTVPPLTHAYFEQYDLAATHSTSKASTAAAETLTADAVGTQSASPAVTGTRKIPINWDLYFVAGERRIARGGKIAWPEKLTLDDMRQGPLGDCYFIGVLGSMVTRDSPEDVRKIIQPMGDGEYRVTFPSTQPFTLHALTDSELAISSTSSGDGVWLAAMEQAFGEYRERTKNMAPEEGTDTIADGGDPGVTMALLTGHKFKRIRIARYVEQRDAKAAQIIPLIRTELISALHDKRLITLTVSPVVTPPTTGPTTHPAAAAGKMPAIPPNITTKHVYAITGYDPVKDTLEVWNPHGQAFSPKGEQGLTNGYTTLHGRFTLPLKEAYQFATSFTVELAVPTTQSTTAPVATVR